FFRVGRWGRLLTNLLWYLRAWRMLRSLCLRSMNGMSRRGPLWWKAPEDSCVHWRTLCYGATINHLLFPVFLHADPTWRKNCLRFSASIFRLPDADDSA